MVSKISEPQVRVVSPAAYLLFYRRRSSEPLGPQYLRELVQTARNAPDNASTTSSDDELASGKGTLGGPHSSRLLGSSSDGAKAGAGAGVPGAGSLHPRAPGGGDGSADALSDRSPSARRRRSSEDEGLGMYDEDQPAYPSIVSAGGEWSFAGLNDDRVSDAGRSDEANLSSTPATRRTTPIDNLFEDDAVEQRHEANGWEEDL